MKSGLFMMAASVLLVGAAGCGGQLKDEYGNKVSLSGFDRISVGKVQADNDVPKEMESVLANSLSASLSADPAWNQLAASNPKTVVVNVFLNKLYLPGRIDQIISGAKPKITCIVTISDPTTGKQIASTDEFNSPRRSIVSMAMSTGFSGMAMNFLKMKQYDPSYCMELAPHVSDEIIEMLDKARK